MKISILSIGIEVAEAVVEVLTSEPPQDPARSEPVTGIRLIPSNPRGYRAALSVILAMPDDPRALLSDGGHGAQGRTAANRLGDTAGSLLTQTGRLGLRAVLARSALLALPALAVLVAPKVARAMLPAAGRNASLRDSTKGFLPDQPPRLPSGPQP